METATCEKLPKELITASEFAAILGVTKRTLFRLRAKRAIPLPLKISNGILRWRTKDVRAYLDRLGSK
jgi:predicted DNA-binding transcriptional regulator AlpA